MSLMEWHCERIILWANCYVKSALLYRGAVFCYNFLNNYAEVRDSEKK